MSGKAASQNPYLRLLIVSLICLALLLIITKSTADIRDVGLMKWVLRNQYELDRLCTVSDSVAEERASPGFHRLWGVVDTKCGRSSQAVVHLEVVKRLRPHDITASIMLGLAYEAAGRHQEAIQVLSQHSIVLILIQLAQTDLTDGNLDQAEVNCILATEIAPDSEDAFYCLNDVYRSQKRFDLARQAAFRAISLDSQDSCKRFDVLGQLSADNGCWEKAIGYFEEAVTRCNYPVYHFKLGNSLWEGRRDAKRAVSEFQFALQFDKGFLNPYIAMAELYAETNRPDLVEKTYLTLLDFDPKNCIALRALSNLYLQTSDILKQAMVSGEVTRYCEKP